MAATKSKEGARLGELTDEALLARIVARDSEAFDEIYSRHRSKVRGVIVRVVKSTEGADGLVNATFFNVWRFANRFRFDSKFTTWLYRIAANEALQHLRRQRKSRDKYRPVFVPLEGEARRIEIEPINFELREKAARLVREIKWLEQSYLGVVTCLLEELPWKEGCAVTGLSMAAFKSRVYRARIELQKVMHE